MTEGVIYTTGATVATHTSNQSLISPEFRDLITELREQNFDTIRFATYRAACKLRFIQKKVNLHLVDIWNIIESFRENGLNVAEPRSEVKISRVELLLSTVYHNLNKRLPTSQQIDTDRTISLLLSFLLAAYDRDNAGKLRVFSVKVALATLCAGKLLDKLRYIFSQISDTSGVLDMHKFAEYLREVLSLPTAVFEGPTFGYSDGVVRQCFDGRTKITVNVFLDTMMADPCPPCLMWLPLLHRMASVEHVFHPVVCDACNRDSFTGFRYKCQRCHNYQLCQDCFWRGRISGSHSNQHEMKEYSSYKSPARQLGHSISKSLRCIPAHPHPPHAAYPEYPPKPLDLSNVVPSSPVVQRRASSGKGYPISAPGTLSKNYDGASLGTRSSESPSRSILTNGAMLDDEHKLIARYSAKLAAGRHNAFMMARNAGADFGALARNDLSHRAAIAELEQRRCEMVREIQRLQAAHQAAGGAEEAYLQDGGGNIPPGSGILQELTALRTRKDELEQRMLVLQESRRDLMSQLEELMKQVKTTGTPLDMSPRSPSSSLSGVGDGLVVGKPPIAASSGYGHAGMAVPSHVGQGPPRSIPYSVNQFGAGQQQTLPGMGIPPPAAHSLTALTGMTIGSGVETTPKTYVGSAALQNDLLSAADSITNTMSNLVKELGTGEGEETANDQANQNINQSPMSQTSIQQQSSQQIPSHSTQHQVQVHRQPQTPQQQMIREMKKGS